LPTGERVKYPSGDPPLRNPTTGIFGCCARAPSGHVTATLDLDTLKLLNKMAGGLRRKRNDDETIEENFELRTAVQPDMLTMALNTRIMDFERQTYEMRIRDADNNPLWYVYPRRQRGCDVVAVPLTIRGDDPIVNMYPINLLKS
jgi:hypothetical protein